MPRRPSERAKYPTLATALRLARESVGMTQVELANAAGISVALVRSGEYGLRSISGDSWSKLIRVLTIAGVAQDQLDELDQIHASLRGGSLGEPVIGALLASIVNMPDLWEKVLDAAIESHRIAIRCGTDESARFTEFVGTAYLIVRDGARNMNRIWDVAPDMIVLWPMFIDNERLFTDWGKQLSIPDQRAALAAAVAVWRDPRTMLPLAIMFAGTPLRIPAGPVLSALGVRFPVGTTDAVDSSTSNSPFAPHDSDA